MARVWDYNVQNLTRKHVLLVFASMKKMYISYDFVITLHYKKYSEGLGTKQLKMEFSQIVQDKNLYKFVSQLKITLFLL